MRGLKNINLFSIFFLLLLGFFANASETDELKVEIKALSTEIKISEPLILEIKVTCKTPQINSKTGEIATEGGIKPYLVLNKKGQEEDIIYKTEYGIIDKSLPIYDKQKKGLEYTGSLFVFYDFMKRELFFDEPNEYTCHLESRVDKFKSNTIKINVKPAGELEEKAMSIFIGRIDMAILGQSIEGMDLDFKNEPEAKGIWDRYKQVVDQCSDTIIGKMASAILGIKDVEELENKYRDGEKFMEQYKKGGIEEPLIKSAKKYLSFAYKLPNEFPVREIVLNKLAILELLEGNNQKVYFLFDELTTKYPNGKYGKRAEKDKEQFKTLMERNPNLADK